MNYSMPSSLSFTTSQSLLRFMSTESVMYYPATSSSVVPFSSLQPFPAAGSFPMSRLFASGGQSIGASASTSALVTSIQGWFPLGLTGLIWERHTDHTYILGKFQPWPAPLPYASGSCRSLKGRCLLSLLLNPIHRLYSQTFCASVNRIKGHTAKTNQCSPVSLWIHHMKRGEKCLSKKKIKVSLLALNQRKYMSRNGWDWEDWW